MRKRQKTTEGQHVWFGFRNRKELVSRLSAQMAAAQVHGLATLVILGAENLDHARQHLGKQGRAEDVELEDLSRYFDKGALAKDALILRLQRFARERGAGALIVLEVRPDMLRRADLLKFETEIGDLTASTGSLVICAHKLGKPLTAVEVSLLHGHTHLLVDGLICQNPQEMLFAEALAPQPESTLATMKSRALFFERRKQQNLALADKYKGMQGVLATRNRALELLHALDLRLGQTFDPALEAEVFLEIVEHAAELRESALWLNSSGEGWLDLIGSRHLPEPVLDRRMPFGIDPVLWFSRYLADGEEGVERKAIIAIPLTQEDNLVGLLCAVRGDRVPLGKGQARLLSTMAGIMARVLIRIGGYRQLELSRSLASQERQAAEMLRDISARVVKAGDPDSFFKDVQAELCHVLGPIGISCVVSIGYRDIVVESGCAGLTDSEREWLRHLPDDVLRRLVTEGSFALTKGDVLAPERDSSYYLARVTVGGESGGVWMFRGKADLAVTAPHVLALLQGVAEQSGHYLLLTSEKAEAQVESSKGSALIGFIAGLDSTNSPEALLRQACATVLAVLHCKSALGVILGAGGDHTWIAVADAGEQASETLCEGLIAQPGGPVKKELPRLQGSLHLAGDEVLRVLTVAARDSLGARGLLMAPLASGREEHGYLLAALEEEGGADSADLGMIAGIAHVTGVNLAGMLAYRQVLEKTMVLSKRVEEIKQLHQIDRLMLANHSKTAILRSVLNSLPDLLPIDAAAICLLDEDGSSLRLVHSWSKSGSLDWPDQVNFSDGGPLSQAVGGRVSYVADADHEIKLDILEASLGHDGFLSQLWVPLTIMSKVVGVMVFLVARPAGIELSHLETVENISSQVAVALRNSELLEASSVSVSQLVAVNEAHNAFSGDASLEEALTSVGAHVREVLDCRYAAIGVYDLNGKFRFVPSGLSHEQVDKIGIFPSGQGLLGHLLRHKGVTRLDDLSDHPGSVGFPPHHPPMRSFVGGPITYKDRILGALYCTEKRSGAFSRADESFIELMTGGIGMGLRNILLIEQMHNAFLAMVKSLGIAVEMRDPGFTYQHLERMPRYSVLLAKKSGLGAKEIEGIEAAAYLHDLGKLGVPEAVMQKRSTLSKADWQSIREHPGKGCDVLGQVKFPWPIADIVRHHHERFDGTGYPDKLRGEAIAMGARIVAVVDAWDAMTNDRPYRKRLTESQARKELIKGKGTQFDPALVDKLLEILNEEEAAEAKSA